jgi:hypothetical protein
MPIIGTLFAEPGQITEALDALEADDFQDFTVFGPEELFTGPVLSPQMEEQAESQRHMAAGTVSGISVNPRPYAPDDPNATSAHDDLRGMGIGERDADRYVSGLHQNQTLLLVQTAAGRATIARGLLEKAGGRTD